MSDEKPMGQVIQIDEARIRDHLGEMVRGTVEETLNAMLDAEADQLCGAGRYERSEARQDRRAGSYERTLQTRAGEVSLKIPKLRRQTFETTIIERYRRRESSVEEALIEMYLAGISVRRVEDITEALWGTRVSPSTVSNLNKKIYAKIEAWRNRRIEGEDPYLYLDGIVMKRSWAGEVRNVSLLVASAVNSEGFREILGICEGAKEDKSGWSAFLRHLVDRGLTGVQLIISDACRGLMESAAEYLPEARWQRCMVHSFRFVGPITERPAAPGRRGLLVQQSSAGQIARIAQTTSIRGPALRLQESPGFGFTPPSVPSLRMPGERSLAFASPCAPRVRRWETIPDRLADHTSKYSQVFRPGIRYADTVETRKHRNCRLWIQYLR